jgi:hypothetical protein
MNRTRSIAVTIVMSVLLPQFANAQAGTIATQDSRRADQHGRRREIGVVANVHGR